MQTILAATPLFRWLNRCRGKTEIRPQRESHELLSRKILALPFPTAGKLLCQQGRVWITLDGQREDIILTAGQALEVSAGSRLLVEALEDGRLEIAA